MLFFALLLRLYPCLLHGAQVELQYGFLYESYHVRRYYWESVILLQKLVLVTAVTTLQSVGTAPQVLVVAGVLTVAMILQVSARTYWRGT
jgi:hypothetical protein